jgi:streptogramin lyase
VDSSGDVWVVDAGNHRIQKFNSEGEYLSQFGSEGSGNGQFEWATGIAVDSSDDVWVADAENDRIQKFNSEGEYLSQFGAKGSGNAQFRIPYGIEVDASDDVWVADSFNHRVQKWIPNRPAVTTEAATEVTAKAATMHGAVNPNGLATSYHFEIGTSSAYGFSIPVSDEEVGVGPETVEVENEVAGLKTKTTYHFRVVATNAEGTSYGKDETFTTK